MKTRDKIIILALGTLLLGSVLTYFIILPTTRDIKAMKVAIYNERVDLERKYQRGQLLKKTVKDFEKILPEQQKLIGVSLTRGEELNFITTLEAMAAKHAVEQAIEIGFDQLKDDEAVQKIPLTLNLRGSFGSLMQYLQELERLHYYITISAFQLNATNQLQSDSPLHAMLQGNIYVMTPLKK